MFISGEYNNDGNTKLYWIIGLKSQFNVILCELMCASHGQEVSAGTNQRPVRTLRLPLDQSDNRRRAHFWLTKIPIFYCYSADTVDQTAMSSREALNMKLPPIQSTAGAVPIRNEKGET